MRVVGGGDDRPRVGLVLGAGGVLGGAWLAGTLATLTEQTGWDPAAADVIVGTSAGSMIGALLASGVPPWFMVAHSAGETFPGLLDAQGNPTDEADRSAGGVLARRRGVFPDLRPHALKLGVRTLVTPHRHRPGVAAAAFAPRGLMSTRPLRETIHRVVPEGWAPHPAYWAVATDLESGRRVVFGREDAPKADLSAAVAASCAVPAIYRPVHIDGRRYVDGGAWSPSNLDCVARLELDLVICLNPMSSRPEELVRAGRGALRGRLRRSNGRRLGWEARRLRDRGTAVVLIQPLAEDLEVMGGNLMSTARRHMVLSRAQETAAAQVEQEDLARLLSEQPRIEAHRLRRPEGPVSEWPEDALPAGTSVVRTQDAVGD